MTFDFKICLYLLLIFVSACNSAQTSLKLVAVQHTGSSNELSDDVCRSLYRNDGRQIVTPVSFKLTPYQAIILAKNNLDYSCSNKFGAQIYADSESYFIVRLAVISEAIIINGTTGKIISEGFMRNRNLKD